MNMKCGHIHDARLVFDDVSCRDSVSWNSLNPGYSEKDLPVRLLRCFIIRIIVCSLQLNNHTLGSILDAMSNSISMEQGMQRHSHVIKSCLMNDESIVVSKDQPIKTSIF